MKQILTMILIYLPVALGSYIIGSFSPSYIIGRIKKVDLKKIGTKNLGMSNATVVFGWKLGVLVGATDILKGCVAVLLTKFLAPELPGIAYVAAACAVLGHIFPFYLKGKGGKGFATYLGAILGLDFRIALVLGLFIIVLAILTNYIVTGTFITITSFPIYTFVLTGEWYSALLMAGISAIMFYKHIENIKRIKNGTEGKVRPMFAKDHRQKSEAKLKEMENEERQE